MNVFDRHEFGVLQFSGGKDSLACLHMLKPYWDKLIVVWVNSGSVLPETIEQMRKIKETVPYFLEIKSNQPEDIELNGLPVDVLPYTNDGNSNLYEGTEHKKLRLFWGCCKANLWEPMQKAMNNLNATLVIRGQKNSDTKSAGKSGDIVNGVELYFPLEDMNDDEVFKYLKDNEIDLPIHYDYINSSLDCWNCTAYIFENVGKVRYMKDYHPEKASQLIDDLKYIRDYTEKPLKFINQALEV